MNIAIIGSGYVGLVTGACLSELGNKVICVDIDKEKISKLNSLEMPIFEPGLETIIKKNFSAKRLSFTTEFDAAVKQSEIVFIAVGTPPLPDGCADLQFVEAAAKRIAEVSVSQKIVVEKSTVPVETGERIKEILKKHNPHKIDFLVVSNPEFLREGSAVNDFLQPERIVIGTDSEKARETMQQLYAPLNAPILFTDIKSSELIKHASNAFLATKISFINAIANICERTGANVKLVAEGMGLDKRIGKSFLNAGLGYGGFCFPKDTEAFIHISEKLGYDFSLLKEVQNINDRQNDLFAGKIIKELSGKKNPVVAVLGLAFKPNTDDLRFAKSLEIIKRLKKAGISIKAFDPVAMENAKKVLSGITLCDSAIDCFNGADAIVLVTEWPEFLELDFKKAKSIMNGKLVFDGRNFFSKQELEKLGFKYFGIGV